MKGKVRGVIDTFQKLGPRFPLFIILMSTDCLSLLQSVFFTINAYN